MNSLALLAFAVWAMFMRYLPNILQFMRLRKFGETIPGPGISEFIENTKKGHILEWMRELRKKHGPTFRIWFGKDLMIFFTDPEDIKQILSNNTLLYKSHNYKLLEPWLGQGLLTSGGDEWHKRRKLLTPAFHFKILSEYHEPIEENCKILIQRLQEKAKYGEQFDIYPYITLFALDAICETAMGIKKNAQLQNDSEYVRAVQNVCHILHKQSFSIWKRMQILFNFSASGRQRNTALKILHSETSRVIKLRRKMLQESKIQTMADVQRLDSFDEKRRLAFLDMLLITQMEEGILTDKQIREEVDTFMFEGHDTTSSAISFAIYLLSKNPKEQQRAYEESLDLVGREKEHMPYLEAVIKETLRLYPSVPFFSRKIVADVQIGKWTVPKGASINTSVYIVHRDEKNFPEPEKFRPERFLVKKNDEHLHPFAFIAFSAGPRNCIGQKFAMLELKCTLSNILRHFEILPVDNYAPLLLAELVTKSANGIQIRLAPRK